MTASQRWEPGSFVFAGGRGQVFRHLQIAFIFSILKFYTSIKAVNHCCQSLLSITAVISWNLTRSENQTHVWNQHWWRFTVVWWWDRWQNQFRQGYSHSSAWLQSAVFRCNWVKAEVSARWLNQFRLIQPRYLSHVHIHQVKWRWRWRVKIRLSWLLSTCVDVWLTIWSMTVHWDVSHDQSINFFLIKTHLRGGAWLRVTTVHRPDVREESLPASDPLYHDCTTYIL